MKNTLLKTTLAMAGKSALPAILGALGTLAAVAYSDGFNAFCGL